LIEILVVIGIIAVLAAIVIIAINPARQFAQARNTQRTSNVESILNAIGQRMADNKGLFVSTGCTVDIPTATGTISSSGINIASCLVPTYMPSMVIDPTGTTTAPTCTPIYTDSSNYNTCYQVVKDASTGRVTVIAPDAELGATISLIR